MKNIIITILTLTTLNVVGQNHFIGMKGGVNWANISSSNFINDVDYRKALSGGLTYEYLFKKHFSLGADLIYNQRGFTYDIIFTDDLGNPTGGKATSKYTYDYISLPIKVGFNFGKTIYGFANIGLTSSVLINAKTTTPSIDFNGTIIPEENLNTTSKVNKFDIGGLVEIGVGYKIKERYWLYSTFSYQQSFTTITNSNYFSNSKIRHTGMTLTIGLTYALTKQ